MWFEITTKPNTTFNKQCTLLAFMYLILLANCRTKWKSTVVTNADIFSFQRLVTCQTYHPSIVQRTCRLVKESCVTILVICSKQNSFHIKNLWQRCFTLTQCQSVSTFESEVQNSLSALEPHSMDSLGHQHHTKVLSPKITLHFKVLCKSKATLPPNL